MSARSHLILAVVYGVCCLFSIAFAVMAQQNTAYLCTAIVAEILTGSASVRHFEKGVQV